MARLHQYIQVDKLPGNAVKVSEYAKEKGIDTSLVYHRLTRNRADYYIVVFHGINFVVPN